MKRLLLIFFLLTAFIASAQIEQVLPKKPAKSEGLVHDYAGILTAHQEEELERKLVSYDDSTSNQIVIVTLPTLVSAKNGAQYEDEEVALRILRDWGVGQAGRNNGIVILIVKSADDKERAIRIETGYGLEGAVPDITAKAIIDHDMAPSFRTGDYYRGLDEATTSIIKAAAGEYKAPEGYNKRKSRGTGIGAIAIGVIVLLVIFGSGFGGGGGGYVSRRGYRGWWPGGFIGGGGGGWSGGGGGGGWSGGGGGFGGFGGGSGGGGGASGSW